MNTIRILTETDEVLHYFEGEQFLSKLLEEKDIHIDMPCGGKGVCGKCIVRVLEGGYRSMITSATLPFELSSEGYVLACQTRAMGDITIQIPGQWIEDKQKILVSAEILESELIMPKKWEIEPVSRKYYLTVPPSTLDDNFSDFDRVTREVSRLMSRKKTPCCELDLLRELPSVLREKEGRVTVGVLQWEDTYNIINFQAGDTEKQHYGIACDIGTTTIAIKLVDLNTGEILGWETDYNKQVQCGADIISRIEYAKTHDGLKRLRKLVVGTINELIGKLAYKYGIKKRDLTNAVFTGNPTMLHLFVGLDPRYIRREPYVPIVNQFPPLRAWELGLTTINPYTIVYCPPGVGSYVGGDITAGLLCITRNDDVMMYLDIGTNGELVIGNKDWLITCACSAGPAFEGGGLTNGMRATFGAIEWLEIKNEGADLVYQTIGGTNPKGIAGTGVICLIGELFRNGIIDQAGKIDRSLDNKRIQEVSEGQIAYVIEWGDQTYTGRNIYITEQDIENILRAKAAIFSASRLIMNMVGIQPEDISRVYIAGGLGSYLNLESAISIGLFPDIDREKFHYIGNASLMGSYISLLSRKKRVELEELASSMTYIDLSVNPDYMDEFMGALFIPHTDMKLFPSVSIPGN